MSIYFCVLTLGSLLYFGLIARYTGRWNSTFSGFWLVNGGVHLILWILWILYPGNFRQIAGGCLLAGWIVFFMVEAKILSAMRCDMSAEAAYIIVLGAQVRGTRITASLMHRLDCAYRYLILHPNTKVIVSGGQGKGEDISEAEAMKRELVKRGIERNRILLEDRSTSTEENLKFSAGLISDRSLPVALVTNNFHVCRALMIGKAVGYENLRGLAATSHPVMFVHYMVREFFGVLLTKIKAML